MSKSSEFDIRYSEMSDLKMLKKWLSRKEDLFWFPFSGGEKIDESARNWIGFSRYRASLTAIHQNKPCGIGTLFLMPYKKVAHNCLIYLIVDPKYRKKGIGRSLVKNLKNLAQNYFSLEGIYAEIFEGCELLSILEKEGFKISAMQENYVKDAEGKYRSRILMEIFFNE